MSYERGFSFAGFQANSPGKPLSGQRLDIELDGIAEAFAELLANGVGVPPDVVTEQELAAALAATTTTLQKAISDALAGIGGGGGTAPVAVPAQTLKANLTNGTAIPQDVSLSTLAAPGNALGDAIAGRATVASVNALGDALATKATVASVDALTVTVAGKLAKTANLSDLADPTAARGNLQLGSAATRTAGTAAGNVLLLDANGQAPASVIPPGNGVVPEAPNDGQTYARKGQGWVPFVPGSGAGGNTNLAQREFYITDYGATPGSDVRPAFASALAALQATTDKAGVIIVPPGRWQWSGAQLDVSNCRCAIVGGGRGVSQILKTTNGGLFYARHTVDPNTAMTHVHGMSLLTSVMNTGIPVDIEHIANNDAMQGSTVCELDIRANDTSDVNSGWSGTAGIRLKNAIGAKVERNAIRGPNGSYNKLARGISLEGLCTDFLCKDNRVYFADIAFYQNGNSETVMHKNNVCLLCNYGLYAVADTDNAGNKVAGGIVDGCHYNTRVFGVRIISRQHWRILSNLIYRWTEAGLTHVGIQVEDCNDAYISGNAYIGFKSSYGGTTTAIVIANCVDAIALGNKCRDANVLMDWNNTSSGIEGLNTCPSGVVRLQSTQGGVGSVSYGGAGSGVDPNIITFGSDHIQGKVPYRQQLNKNLNLADPTKWDFMGLYHDEENAKPSDGFLLSYWWQATRKAGGTGFRQLGTFHLISEAAESGAQMTAVTGAMELTGGRGIAFGFCSYSIVGSSCPTGAGTAAIGYECDISVRNGFVEQKTGIQVIDLNDSTGYGTNDDAGFTLARQQGGRGFRTGYLVGLQRGNDAEQTGNFGVYNGGTLFGTAYSSNSFKCGLDLSNIEGLFSDAAIHLPNNSTIAWGYRGTTNGPAGKIASLSSSSAGYLFFRDYGQQLGGISSLDSFCVTGGQVCTFRKAGLVQGVTIPALSAFETRLVYQVNVPGAVRGDWVQASISSAAAQYRVFDVRGVIMDDNGTLGVYVANTNNVSTPDTGGTNIRFIVERFAT